MSAEEGGLFHVEAGVLVEERRESRSLMGRSEWEVDERRAARRCCSRMKVRSTERKAWVRIVEMVGGGGGDGEG